MYAAVGTYLQQGGMPLERPLLGVFEYQQSSGAQQLPCEHKFHNLFRPFEVIRRIGEYHIEPFRCALQVKKALALTA